MGLGARWVITITRRLDMVLENIRSFWGKNDPPILSTITNEKLPYVKLAGIA